MCYPQILSTQYFQDVACLGLDLFPLTQSCISSSRHHPKDIFHLEKSLPASEFEGKIWQLFQFYSKLEKDTSWSVLFFVAFSLLDWFQAQKISRLEYILARKKNQNTQHKYVFSVPFEHLHFYDFFSLNNPFNETLRGETLISLCKRYSPEEMSW